MKTWSVPAGCCIVFCISVLSVAASSVQPVIVFDMESKSRSLSGMQPPVYPHAAHEKLFECSVCHPDLFIAEIGANKVTMKALMTGKYCGKCHDGMSAFGMSDCVVCHKIE